MKNLLFLFFSLSSAFLLASELPNDTIWVTGYTSVGMDSFGNTLFGFQDTALEGFERPHDCIRRAWAGDFRYISQCKLELHPDFPGDPAVLGLPTAWLTPLSIAPPVKWAVVYPTSAERGIRIIGESVQSINVSTEKGESILTLFPEGDQVLLDTELFEAGVYHIKLATSDGETHILKIFRTQR